MHTDSTSPTIAFLGTGLMGQPMAQRLLDAGYALHVWNRTASKTEALCQAGAHGHASAAQAVAAADITIAMLESGAISREVLQAHGVAQALRPGSLFIDMGSMQPREAREHAALLQARGVLALDAPVSGGTVGAQAGTLAIMVGGPAEVFERAQVQALLAVLGRATRVGEAGSGQLAKLVNQMIVGITIGAVAEGLLLAEKGGADPAKVREAMAGGFAQSRILELHGQRMVAHDFAPRGRMSVQLKDLRNVLVSSAELGFEAPITALLAQLYQQALDGGLGPLDHSALFLQLAQRNHMHTGLAQAQLASAQAQSDDGLATAPAPAAAPAP
ncbi:2-hydroxy-3-oxopropionate reductase [Vandammella animalimorsus]|uniref:2-hydroxy-3-oxopropionate reductase n=1 Tax=Vandammella animalimorsus TaxID=2029117 RepID=A0A2A2T5L0_9BURK|nr:NAD(P)-dependent oxidoreductase [Vandammella animalimorsus]PAT32546.1 2-hydroxy-3-oxopropionate reductase [Vandammella animalimorsus]PAX16870.1 2-hydroxy-3-oxopropionate reductase [Vandammella animalimorsus]PAX20331.1 2-hydroxy-3-oxopropionate reductase [Vandammella animalimorsus]